MNISKLADTLPPEQYDVVKLYTHLPTVVSKPFTQKTLAMILNWHTMTSLEFVRAIQKSSTFDPSKKIKFCISPFEGVEVWTSVEPSDIVLTKEHLDELHSELVELFKKTFNNLLPALKAKALTKPQYLRFEGLNSSLQDIRRKLLTEEWLDELILDPLDKHEEALRMKREMVVYAGPTSSGKTYHALQHFNESASGLYVGPLRLNAIEIYESCNEKGIPCNLVTGEEKIYADGAKHQASTVELMDFKREVDVVLVDEGQFIDDPERGHNFHAAIAGAKARKVIVTCPIYAAEKIMRLGRQLNMEVSLHKLERKTKLTVMDKPMTGLFDIPKRSAIVGFSRRRLLEIKSLIPKDMKVAIIYGALPPEVKREQARRFREGEVDVLLATDCIGIGLNLPIETIVFDAVEKFDGIEVRELTQQEALQVGGRAGRYGLYAEGFVAGTTQKDHDFLKGMIGTVDKTQMLHHFYISAPFEMIEEAMARTGSSLYEATKFIYERVKYDKRMYALSDPDMIMDNIRYIERVAPDLESKMVWKVAHIPLQLDDCEDVFKQCLRAVEGIDCTVDIDSTILASKKSFEALYKGYQELLVRLDCVMWFMSTIGTRFSNVDSLDIIALREKLISRINTSLPQRQGR